MWVGKQKLCWKWNQALLPLPEAHKSSQLMVPQNRPDWLQRGSGMHQECGVKPRVPLTFGRRCVCHCSPPKSAAQCTSKAISIYFHGPCRPSALLRCHVSSCGRSWALQKAQKYGKLSWGQWSQVISGEMAPIWGQLHPFSPWDRDAARKGEDEPVKYGPGEEEENSWGTPTLGQGVTTKCGSHPTLPGVLGTSLVCQCAALSGYCTWQCSGGGVLCSAVRVDTATAQCQHTSPCFSSGITRSQDFSTDHTFNIKTSKWTPPARLTELIYFSHQFYAVDSLRTSATYLPDLQYQLQLHQAFCTHCFIIWQHCCSRQEATGLHSCSWAKVVDDQVCRSTKSPTMWFTQQWYSRTARN